MDSKRTIEKLASLIAEIKKLGKINVFSIDFFEDRIKVQVYGANNLPDGEVKYRIFEKERICDYPWEAVVTKDGIEYYALVSFDDAWALYV